MKKHKLSLVSLFVLSVSCFPQAVFAEDPEDRASVLSNSYVELLKNDGGEEIQIVDPTDPSRPVLPAPDGEEGENPHAPSTKGPLSINYISNLRFGKQTATGNDAVYEVQPDRVIDEASQQIMEVPNFIQVTDNRGTNVGWTLTVRQNGAFKNGANELNGTELVFTHPVMSSVSGKMDTAPSTNANFTLNSEGQSALVMTADSGHGMGTWLERFGEDNAAARNSILLKIPGDAKKVAGFYQTSLTWTLSDAPMNE